MYLRVLYKICPYKLHFKEPIQSLKKHNICLFLYSFTPLKKRSVRKLCIKCCMCFRLCSKKLTLKYTISGPTCVPPVLEHGSVLTISGDNGDLNPGGDPNRGGDLNNGGDLWVGQFTCDPGYLLVGSPSLKCRAGTWSSQTPKCTGTLCRVYTKEYSMYRYRKEGTPNVVIN